MPYDIKKKKGKWLVVKKGGGKVMGEHETKEKAVAQLRALYASES